MIRHSPNLLQNAPMQYAPENELGVVFLFSSLAKKLRMRIEKVKPSYPDCIAYRKIGTKEKRIRIEFELNARNFKTHNHSLSGCDCIVCWNNDWPDAPKKLEIIELRKFYGLEKRVWIQPCLKSQWHWLEDCDKLSWGLSKSAKRDDLLLMYRCYPATCITDIFVVKGEAEKRRAGWRKGYCYGFDIARLCELKSPVFFSDLKNHRVLKTSYFVRRNMQGNLNVTEFWPYVYDLILRRNKYLKNVISKFSPEKM